MRKQHIVTWDMLKIYTKKLAYQIYSIKHWTNIVAVSRGGLIPGALLARELSIRNIDTICISSYNYTTLKKIKLIKNTKITDPNTIIIDDLVDTGGTAKFIKSMYPNAYFVTIFAKPNGKKLVDKYVIDIPQDVWIEQPWDMEISYNAPLIAESDIV